MLIGYELVSNKRQKMDIILILVSYNNKMHTDEAN